MNVNHSRWHHLASLVCLLALVFAQPVTARQNPPAAPALTPEEIKIYESFRAWIGSQPKDVQDAADDVVYQRYAAVLRTQGKSEQEATAAIVSLQSIGDRAEIERWNRILTAPKPRFNTAPNAFLVAVTTGLKPGRSLDVGMGQGRNTIYLAQHGWESVGVDPADRAVSDAQEEARRLGVKITTHVARAEDFEWGTGAWDLIVLSYVGVRDYAPKVVQALRRRYGRGRRVSPRRDEGHAHRRRRRVRYERAAAALFGTAGGPLRRRRCSQRLRKARDPRRAAGGGEAMTLTRS